MKSLTTYIQSLYSLHDKDLPLPTSLQRRQDLIREMKELEGKTIHCFTCPGTCCTQTANSMLITPIEALEILQHLEIEKFTDTELFDFKKRMNDTITNHRLNVEIYTGKKNSQLIRKTYTCPFFNHGALGCSLSRGSKPYGCLGFNPKTLEDNGKSCSSNTALLEERDHSFLAAENLANDKIKQDLKILWNKQNIPQALLDVLEKIKSW